MMSNYNVLPNAFIYIIYPTNINKRLYYIGQTTDFKKRKSEHYKNLININNITKCYQIMREVYKSDKMSNDIEINKYWNIYPIFEGLNVCSQQHLNTIEGIYIYYFYSILNDKAPSNFNIISIENRDFYYKIGFDQILSFIDKNQYNINPWELINKNNIDCKTYNHIYNKLCKNQFIIKFNNIMPFHKCQFISTANCYKFSIINDLHKNKTKINRNKCPICKIKSYKFKNKWYKKHTKICMKNK